MTDEGPTRIEEILADVKQEVARRRAVGAYGDGYEAGIEQGHNAELGKLDPAEEIDLTELMEMLRELTGEIRAIGDVERDTARFRPWRYVRELAMTRHQVVKLNRSLKGIAELVEMITRQIVETETRRTLANERAAQDLLDAVLARTVVLDRLVEAYTRLEGRLDRLESQRRA